MKEENVKKVVRENYAKVARGSSCCSGSAVSSNCCGQTDLAKEISSNIGYSEEDLNKVPEGSNLGLGCGNPIAMASLAKGEIVLDLGSGAGFDCFLAAEKIGPEGRIIGVDMTPEMLEKARENAKKGNFPNVEFRLGEIENLPVADEIIDIIISNCVINLAPDKDRVFSEAFRVLKPGGRIMVSDIVLTKELPDFVIDNVTAYVGCISGATIKDSYLNSIKKAGFTDVKIMDEAIFPITYIASDGIAATIINDLNLSENQINDLKDSILSIKVYALKPKR
ncbi:MAG: arsenite methyltransferase [Actinobacteria bacterium]|nr:arsenite methyltransferase [Actinomycetota bacterium]MCL5072040.1 arsenite methyltransferase [Actinomycetota bacterium]